MKFALPLRRALATLACGWAAALGALRAPLGVHAILGNHDWWDEPEAQRARKGPTLARRALEKCNARCQASATGGQDRPPDTDSLHTFQAEALDQPLRRPSGREED